MEKILVSIVVIFCLSACIDRKNTRLIPDFFSKPTELRITTKTFSAEGLSEPFMLGDKIGIYVFSDSSYQQIEATAVSLSATNQLEWICRPSIRLGDQPVFLYAYAPYSFTICSHPSCIPLQIASIAEETPDYTYGRLAAGHKPVNRRSPWAVLSIRPVLCHLVFHLKTNSKESVDLSAIQINNRPGSELFGQRGTFNLFSGRFTTYPDREAYTRLSIHPSRTLPFSLSHKEEIKVFPTDRPMEAGEVEVSFLLNTKKYTYAFPEGTCWKAGHRYVYELIFTKGRLSLQKATQELF